MTDTAATPPAEPTGQDISRISIEKEMRASYLDYAMSVIVSRALPDVRDGLKPVHRRILYSMHENGYEWNKPYRKSARVIGDVMGKYHPHGDQAIYDAMVRMAQDFSLRLPLLDGQGNFGSMDGDPPAAMRYTEVRMGKSAHALLEDINQDTVDFQPNYDGSEKEPMVLPSRIPNLLANGVGGIAVGMATNIPPHNLGEILDACCGYIDDPEITVEELLEFVLAPDFPTGCVILGRSGARSALVTGRGSIVMRGEVHFEEIRQGRQAIVATSVPYQVNKAAMIEKIADAVRNKRIEGISELRDESDRDGVRVVFELKRDAVAEVVLNQLYRYSPLQTSFGANMLALNGGRPQLLNLRDMIEAFVNFREEVITRRTKFELAKARDRAHILVGLVTAVVNISEMIKLIRGAPNPAAARQEMLARAWPAADIMPLIKLIGEPGHEVVDGKYRLDEIQARAILELRLHRLTALGRDDIGDELKKLGEKIADFLDLLRSRERLMAVLRDELVEIKEQFATPRKTRIDEAAFDFDDEDLIQREDMVVTVSHAGYVKRVPLATYRAQKRGGKGRSGMATRDEDFVAQVFVTSTHTPILIFSSDGKVFKIKVWRLPLSSPQARGKPVINLVPISEGASIATVMPLPEDESTYGDYHVMFATAKGNVRRNTLDDFAHVMSNGKNAIKLADDDRLVGVAVCAYSENVLLAARGGKCIRFPVSDVRVFKSRTSDGVRGMRLSEGDEVISMSILRHSDADSEVRDEYIKFANARRRLDNENGEISQANIDTQLSREQIETLEDEEQFILSITENGFGKRTSAYEYRHMGRGNQGVINIETSGRNGQVVASFPVNADDQIMMVTDGGQLIRCPIHDIRITGRTTQGVTLFRTANSERVVSVAHMPNDSDEDGDGNEAVEISAGEDQDQARRNVE
ncbi:MAG: DNA gyrase subunit A [Sphingomonadales bacterium]